MWSEAACKPVCPCRQNSGTAKTWLAGAGRQGAAAAATAAGAAVRVYLRYMVHDLARVSE